jgi:membrane-bound lytic murein transglycosylase MltF
MLYYAGFRGASAMKLLARTATGLILSAPFLLRAFALSGAPDTSAYPFRRPVTLGSLQARGSLRVAVSSALAPALNHPSDRADFDYDLLESFASDLQVRLDRRDVGSTEDAARMLESGIADLAVLPVPAGNGFFPTQGACPMSEPDEPGASDDRTLALFARTDSPDLIQAVNGTLPKLAQTANSTGLYERYCVDHKALAEADQVVPWGGQASRYSKLISKYAREVGLDWRLVAAVISEESGFRVHAVSSKGATGLMQLMPGAPGTEDIENPFDPEPNIRAGVLYLRRLQEMFQHSGRSDEIAMVLAAYLVGPGHVLDAQGIARGLGLDPYRWRGGLDHVLPLLELEQFFPKTRCGFARGQQAVGYVNRILERYDLYKRHMDARPDQTAAAETARAPRGSA